MCIYRWGPNRQAAPRDANSYSSTSIRLNNCSDVLIHARQPVAVAGDVADHIPSTPPVLEANTHGPSLPIAFTIASPAIETHVICIVVHARPDPGPSLF